MKEPSDRSGRYIPILLIAGANLTLIQFASIKEFASLAGANEIVLLLVITAYFLGLSLGYLISARLSIGTLAALGVATILLHSTLPFSARYLAGSLARINLGGNILPFIFLLVMFGITPFYAVFLPRFVDAMGIGSARGMVRLYAVEITGGFLGLLLAVVLTPARMGGVLALHLAGLVAIVLLFAGARWKRFALLAALPAVYWFSYPAWNRASLEYFYTYMYDFHDPVVLASEFSPYQRVDLIQEGPSAGSGQYLYLNGNLLYGSKRLNQHNLLVSILPNVLFAPRGASNALVIGGGSLDSARYLAPIAGHLRVVELDETVVRITRQYIQEKRGGFPRNWDLTIDDGKHFLGVYDGPPFDVISIDIPLPTYVQTAMLHSERFFQLARTRLKPGGVFSIALAGRYTARDPDETWRNYLPNRIVAGLLKTFRHVTVAEVEDSSYAWASDEQLPEEEGPANEALQRFLDETNSGKFFNAPALTFMKDATVRQRAAGFDPIREADMQIVLRMSIQK